jgi:hypothetical protein
MTIIKAGWIPRERNCVYQERPDFVPEEVYSEALAAKRHYNANWEWWLFDTMKQYNCSEAEAFEACKRGVLKEFLKWDVIYGYRIGKWTREFMEMDDIFNGLKTPNYKMEIGGIDYAGQR